MPIAIYLAFNAGGAGAHGWGAAMSTDTAFALGALALLTPRGATRLRVFLLTLAVVDDLGALGVIATVYTKHVSLPALIVAIGLFGLLLALRYAPAWRRQVSIVVGVGPVGRAVQVGHRPGHRRACDRPRDERLPALARGPRAGDRAHALLPRAADAASSRARRSSACSRRSRPTSASNTSLHPWTSYVVVPLFALANAGLHVTGGLLEDAISSPITLGILFGYVVGKPLGILGASWLATRPRLHGPRPPLSWPALAGGGAVAGIGFTVSLLISSLASTASVWRRRSLALLALSRRGGARCCPPGAYSGR